MAQDIRTYAGLIAAAQAWLDTAESALTDAIPNMIVMAEADFRRSITAPDTEVTVTINPSSPSLPADVDSIRSFTLLGSRQQAITPLDPNSFGALASTATGAPRHYTVSNNSLSVWPKADATYSATLIYRQAIPAISATSPTNWLLTKHPDAYLFGTMLQGEFYGWNDSRLPIIQAKLASILDDINTAGNRKRYGGPIVMRTTVYDGLGVRA